MTGTCLPPDPNTSLTAGAGFVSRIQNGLVNASLTITSAGWDGSGIIEVEGTDASGGTNNSLFINYFCGRNTFINTNNALSNQGGIVYMGKQVSMQANLQIGDSGVNIDPNTAVNIFQNANGSNALKFNTWNNALNAISITNSNFPKSPFTVYGDGRTYINNALQIGDSGVSIDPNTAVNIFQNANGSNALKFNSWNNSVKMISIDNPNFAKSPFTVYADGRTRIGGTQPTGTHSDALLSVSGKIVAQSVYITIADWADYVFAPDYKVPNLYDVETFYKKNKRLPDIPSSKQVLEKGVNVGEMNNLLLKKVEELTIQMVNQQKKIDLMEEEITKLHGEYVSGTK